MTNTQVVLGYEDCQTTEQVIRIHTGIFVPALTMVFATFATKATAFVLPFVDVPEPQMNVSVGTWANPQLFNEAVNLLETGISIAQAPLITATQANSQQYFISEEATEIILTVTSNTSATFNALTAGQATINIIGKPFDTE